MKDIREQRAKRRTSATSSMMKPQHKYSKDRHLILGLIKITEEVETLSFLTKKR